MNKFIIPIRVVIDTEVSVEADTLENAQNKAEHISLDKVLEGNINQYDSTIEVFYE